MGRPVPRQAAAASVVVPDYDPAGAAASPEGAADDVGVVDVLGVGISRLGQVPLIDAIERTLRTRERLCVTFANPNYLMAGRRDHELRSLINSFDHVLPDGRGVLLATRLLGDPLSERVANDDLTEPLFRMLARRRARVFLLGSAPGIGEQATERLTRTFPGVEIVGSMHGYLDHEEGTPGAFSPRAIDIMVNAVGEARPDFLVVGLPTPKQQRFVMGNLDRLDVPVVMTGGAWIDHLAERIHYYPPIVEKLGLCWAYRWSREPRRLAYRYTVELAGFGRSVLQQRLGRRRTRTAPAPR